MRLAVVIEISDLAIAGDDDAESEERWAEVEHLESAVRFVLARLLGRVAQWTDWIHVHPANQRRVGARFGKLGAKSGISAVDETRRSDSPVAARSCGTGPPRGRD